MALALTVAALFNQVAAHAQGDSLRLTRREAQERALGHAVELTSRAAAVTQARRLSRAPYPHNPELSVDLEGTRTPWSSQEYTRRVRVEQEIDLRGERGARSRVGAATAAVIEHEYTERAQAVVADIDEAYSRHVVAQRRTAFLEPLRERARGLRAKAEGARRRETVTGFEARLLRAEALAIEADWLDARRQLEVSEAELRTWLALPVDSALALDDDLDERSWQCEEDSAMSLAIERRQGLRRVAAAESLAASRVMLERRLGRVNPALGVSVGRERLELEPEGVGPISDEGTFVGLDVRVPLPVFARNQSGISEARLELERARAERAALEREVRQDVTAACVALHRAEEERTLRREASQSAAEDLRLIESAYADGRIPLDEYLTLRERLVRQQVALFDAVGKVEEERARLVRATGVDRAELARRWGGER